MTDGTHHLGPNDAQELSQPASEESPSESSGGTSAPIGSQPKPEVEIRRQTTAEGEAATNSMESSTDDDVQLLLAKAEQAIRSVDEPVECQVAGIKPFELPDLTGTPANTERASLDLLRDVELDLRIELGRTHMYLEDVLQLRKGSVVPLDRLAGDPVDVYVNGRLVARGEVLVLNDNFCVRIAELISSGEGT